MSTTETPTPPSAGAEINHLTNPADLMPAQIAEALTALAKKDGVTIYLNSYEGTPMTWHVLESRPAAGGVETRGGNAPTYESALAACRAAEFSDGKGGSK